MRLTSFTDIRIALQKELSTPRYDHSLAVARLARKLAQANGVNPDEAERAGLVHDCAKEWAPQKFVAYIKKKRIKVPNLEFVRKHSPNMMHAYVGAAWAKQRGWISSPAMVKAVSSHTLADFQMSVLDKIIYVADFAAYDRRYKDAKKIRQVALADLHQAFLMSMSKKIRFSLRKFKPVHPFALEIWNHFNAR